MIYAQRIDGVDFKRKFLTVGDLKKYIAQIEAVSGKSLDDHLVHFLDMEPDDENADEADFAYASHVENDVMDGTEDDPDHPGYKAIPCLSILRWPSKDKTS